MTSNDESERAWPGLSPPSPEELARRVKAGRTYAQMSAAQLAQRVGMGVQTIKRIESAKRTPRRHELWAIAEACGLPRGFYEVDLELLVETAVALSTLMENVDMRLERLENSLRKPSGT